LFHQAGDRGERPDFWQKGTFEKQKEKKGKGPCTLHLSGERAMLRKTVGNEERENLQVYLGVLEKRKAHGGKGNYHLTRR